MVGRIRPDATLTPTPHGWCNKNHDDLLLRCLRTLHHQRYLTRTIGAILCSLEARLFGGDRVDMESRCPENKNTFPHLSLASTVSCDHRHCFLQMKPTSPPVSRVLLTTTALCRDSAGRSCERGCGVDGTDESIGKWLETGVRVNDHHPSVAKHQRCVAN